MTAAKTSKKMGVAAAAPSVKDWVIFIVISRCARRSLLHPFLSFGIEVNGVLRNLIPTDLGRHRREEEVSNQDHDQKRQPPTAVAALDVLKGLRGRREGVGNALPLGESSFCFGRGLNCLIVLCSSLR